MPRFQFLEFALFVPETLGSAGLDFTEPAPTTTTLPLRRLMTTEHQARKGVIILAVVTDPVTMRRDGCFYTTRGRQGYTWNLEGSLGHRFVLC